MKTLARAELNGALIDNNANGCRHLTETANKKIFFLIKKERVLSKHVATSSIVLCT
jgi:hypothetical protein